MEKLTAEKCREQFEEWLDKNAFNKNRNEMGAYEASFCQIAWIGWQASRDALPILEQQERGVSCPTGYRLVPEKLTDEMLRNIIPNMAHSLPISHDEYDYHGRNERFVKWVWARLLWLSETASPERPTNQNGDC